MERKNRRFRKGDSNLGDRDLVRNHSETMNCLEVETHETQNAISGEPKTEESAISNLGGWCNLEITSDGEMQDSKEINVHRDLDNVNEIESPQSLALELIALDNAKDGIWKNEDVRSVKEGVVSKIEGSDKLKELFTGFRVMRRNLKVGGCNR